MIAKCECQQCGQPVEFDPAQFERTGETIYQLLGQSIDCPNCGKATQLYLPRQPASALKVAAKESEMVPCEDCGEKISHRAILCPHCGRFCGVTFRLVFQVVCLVLASFSLIELIAVLFNAAVNALK